MHATAYSANLPTKRGFFAHHGAWAFGVRLFRRLSFSAKASLVSLCFLVPLALLLWAYLGTKGEALDVAAQERAGVQLMRVVEPLVIEGQRQRRRVITGEQAQPDLPRLEAALQEFTKLAQTHPAGVDLDASLKPAREALTQLTQAAASGSGPALEAPLQALVDQLLALRVAVLDASQLSLDPEQASYYLMLASAVHLPMTIEAVSRSRSHAQIVAHRQAAPEELHRLYALWLDAQTGLRAVEDAVAHAEAGHAGLSKALPLASTRQAVDEFLKQAKAPWFGPTFDPATAALNPAGQAAVDQLRALNAAGLKALDGLLAEREDTLRRNRNLTLGILAASLLAALYLFRSFYLVVDGGLREVERHLKAMTSGDLTTQPRPWGQDEPARLMKSLADMQGALRSIVTDVRIAAHGLVNASSEIERASADLSQRSESAAANLQESAAAMEEIAQTVNQTAGNTEQVATLAEGNAKAADRSGTTVASVVETMKDFQTTSSKMSEIIGVIDGIAFQTNVLALNAAVEAARAGDHGRGFAVVASEVRALAQRSALAAREIKTLISASLERIVSTSTVVDDAGQEIGQLVGQADRMRQLMQDILTHAQEQRQGIQLVGSSIQDLDRQTQQNAALVEETAAAAAHLHQHAQSLIQRVERFQLERAEA